MEYLPPVGWNDVVRRHDLELLRADIRTEMNELRVELHQQLSRMLICLVGTILASVGAILGLIAYVD